jgi:hypothetical protein
MGNPGQIQPKVTSRAVLGLAAIKAKHRTSGDGSPALPTTGSRKTSGVTPEVFSALASGNLSPQDCTTQQLFEIVIDVARKFRTAKEVVVEHKDYIIRLKTEVFKVSFGSVGVRVPVTFAAAGKGLPLIRRIRWKEFCETQFGVTADWIKRLCG